MLCKYKIIYIFISSLISILNEINSLKCYSCISSTSNKNLNCHITQKNLKYLIECPVDKNACAHSYFTGYNPVDGQEIINYVRQCIKSDKTRCYTKNKKYLRGYNCFCNEDGCNKD